VELLAHPSNRTPKIRCLGIREYRPTGELTRCSIRIKVPSEVEILKDILLTVLRDPLL
jgi:hypothetical protein